MGKEKNSEDNILDYHCPRYEDLPKIELYMDQLVAILNEYLAPFHSQGEDAIVTATMINNYVKNGLIDAPTRKLYSKIQLAKLFVICILKQVYSMHEIRILIKMALKYGTDEETYNNFCDLFEEALYCTYNKIDFIDQNSHNNSLYLMKSILLSCSYKIYVQYIIKRNKR